MKTIAIIVLCAGSAVALSGCDLLETRITSPIDGTKVTDAQLNAQFAKAERDAKAKADAEAAAAAQAVREAQNRALLEGIALSKKQAVTAAEIAEQTATIQAETGIALSAASAKAEAAKVALNATLETLANQARDAAAEIEAQRSKWAGLAGALGNIPVLKQATSGFGLDLSSLLATAFGGTTLLAARSAAKAKVDAEVKASKAYDEGHADGRAIERAIAEKADSSWDAAQAHTLTMLAPSIKPA